MSSLLAALRRVGASSVKPVRGSGPSRAALALLFVLFLVALTRTAWVCDDAYITFRTIDNWFHGYGLRWNVDERVQTYTHPLWMLLVAGARGLTGEFYFTVLAVSAVATVGALIAAIGTAGSTLAASLVVLTLLCSSAFVDYSTSGLENPLTHLLVAVFLAAYWRLPHGAQRVGILSLVAGLLMANRPDTGLLVLPALFVSCAATWSRRSLGAMALGMAPLVAWEAFALVYYGFPFPNTAYAKLQIGVPRTELVAQGLIYLLNAVSADPLTPATIGLGLGAAWLVVRREAWPLGAGLAIYLVYLVAIGGDFMSGRLLTAPLLVAVLVLTRVRAPGLRRLWPAVALSIVVVTPTSVLLSQTPPASRDGAVSLSGVADERRFYYADTGLLREPRRPLLDAQWASEGHETAARGTRVVVRGDAGFFGFAAGPSVHQIDLFALGDPLLSRLPSRIRWRIGHFPRTVPDGYVESVETGRNVIRDPNLARLYDIIRLITRGPIWSAGRFRAIWTMNTGGYRRLLEGYGEKRVRRADLALVRPAGTPWDGPGNTWWTEVAAPGAVTWERGVAVHLERPILGRRIEVSVSGNDRYLVVYSLAGRELATDSIAPIMGHDGSLVIYRLRVPARAQTFDRLVIQGRGGDYRYSVGHLLIAK